MSNEFTNAEIEVEKKLADETKFNSNFIFLNQHNGLRPGKMHLVLGTAGGGKSTFIRSLLVDMCLKNSLEGKILIWLSEESSMEFMVEMSNTEFNLKDYVDVVSEVDDEIKFIDSNSVISSIELLANENDYSAIIFDNITTSELYLNVSVGEQSTNAKRLKSMAARLNIPLIVAAHTGADINDNVPRLINQNDIRGSKSVVNMAQFLYILQRFICNKTIYPTLRMTKHRGQQPSEKLFYLEYNEKLRIYHRDKCLDFSKFKGMFKQRDVL